MFGEPTQQSYFKFIGFNEKMYGSTPILFHRYGWKINKALGVRMNKISTYRLLLYTSYPKTLFGSSLGRAIVLIHR
jgi:hypothetical protein